MQIPSTAKEKRCIFPNISRSYIITGKYEN